MHAEGKTWGQIRDRDGVNQRGKKEEVIFNQKHHDERCSLLGRGETCYIALSSHLRQAGWPAKGEVSDVIPNNRLFLFDRQNANSPNV